MAIPDLAAAPSLAAAVRWAAAGPLLLSSLAVMGSPGPATISLTAAGSAYGLRRSARYLVGVTAGTTIVLLAVASGVDRKSTRLNSSHSQISYAVFCLKKKKKIKAAFPCRKVKYKKNTT